ncbi:MAG: ribosome maturation factor RimM [Enterobacterales bacterium]
MFINKKIILGKIGSTYGLLGWLKIISYTEINVNIFQYQPWLIKNQQNLLKIFVEKWKFYKKNFLVKIKNIKNIKNAQCFINCYIYIDESQLFNLNSNEYYWKDLIGCKVFSLYGYYFGKVTNLINTGSNDILIVNLKINNLFKIKEFLIPFINEKIVKNVDIKLHKIIVNWHPNF